MYIGWLIVFKKLAKIVLTFLICVTFPEAQYLAICMKTNFGYTLNVHLEISQKILYFVFDMRLFFQHKTRVLCKKIISWNIKKQTEVNYQRNANCFGSNRLFFWHLYDKRVYPSLIHDCGAFFCRNNISLSMTSCWNLNNTLPLAFDLVFFFWWANKLFCRRCW